MNCSFTGFNTQHFILISVFSFHANTFILLTRRFLLLQITTNTGSEYLLQADSNATASKWYDAIRKTIDSSVRTSTRAVTLIINQSLDWIL